LLLFAALQDNLLLKLLDMGEEFLRLGKPESVDSRIQPYVFHNGKAPGTCWRYIGWAACAPVNQSTATGLIY
jgi:hypothetical protein